MVVQRRRLRAVGGRKLSVGLRPPAPQVFSIFPIFANSTHTSFTLVSRRSFDAAAQGAPEDIPGDVPQAPFMMRPGKPVTEDALGLSGQPYSCAALRSFLDRPGGVFYVCSIGTRNRTRPTRRHRDRTRTSIRRKAMPGSSAALQRLRRSRLASRLTTTTLGRVAGGAIGSKEPKGAATL